MLFKGSIRALLVLLLALPAGAFALGLGDIRLLSPLDAPLNAEVEVVDATPDELNTLQAQIASRETFARYGLDYPSYLTDVQAQSTRTADGRQVIQLKSNEPIHQAYLTLLVEVNWARGRTVREYTMLLDPPVYTPGEKNAPAPAPVAAAATGGETRSGEIARAAQTPTPVKAEPPPPPPVAETAEPPAAEQPPVAALGPKSAKRDAAPAPEDDQDTSDQQDTQKPTGGGQHVVKRGETLSQIAADQAQADPRSEQTQIWMLAIYRANPDAFDANMNQLHNRAILRMPEAKEIAAISPTEAADEIHRSYMAWRGSTAAGAAGSGQVARAPGRKSLQLVTPPPDVTAQAAAEDAPQGTAPQAGTGTAEEASAPNKKRLASVKANKLKTLQDRLSDSPASSPTETPADNGRNGVGVDVRQAANDSATPLPPESAPAPRSEPVGAAPAGKALPVASFMSSAMGIFKQLWIFAAAAVMALVLVLALRSWRSRRQAEFDDSLNRLALAGSGLGPLSAEHGFTTNDGMGPLEGVVDEPFTVEDTGRFPVTASRAPIAEDLPPVRPTEAPMGFQEGSDPLAEADFHIGYGMYDQAAELLRAAVEHEPGRRDLRLKLLEVYFETGNRDEFLQLAEELVHTRDQAGPGEWEKIAIMGRQLAPEDPLFADSDEFNAAAAGVDLDLEGGDSQVDYDLGGLPDEQELEFDNTMLEEGMVEEVETGMDYSRPPPATMLRQPQVEPEEMQGQDAFELELDSQEGEIDIESALQEAEMELNGAHGPDSDATMVAGFDERSRRVMEAAAQRRASVGEEEPAMDDWAAHEEIDSMPPMSMDAGATDASQRGNMRAARADRDMGRYDLNDAANGPYNGGDAMADDDMALPDLEPVTMSEVGTKLDLARAYVDMGDPEGARNILEEVLNEGSLAQKQEAQLLLEGLPG